MSFTLQLSFVFHWIIAGMLFVAGLVLFVVFPILGLLLDVGAIVEGVNGLNRFLTEKKKS